MCARAHVCAPAHMYVYMTGAYRCPQHPEEGIRSPGGEGTGSHELRNVGAGNGPLEEQEVLSTAEPSL